MVTKKVSTGVVEKKFSGVGVDAGIILIADYDFYRKYHGRIETGNRDVKKIKLNNGKYYVSWGIPNTWHGNVAGTGVLKVTSGLVVVSDPCYVVGNALSGDKKYAEWDKVLEDTNMFKKVPSGTVLLDKMGGDGRYTVTVVFDPAE